MTRSERCCKSLKATLRLLCLLALTLIPSVASAHFGDHTATDVASAFHHTLSGADHLLALLVAGVVAAILFRRISISAPVLRRRDVGKP